MRQATLSSPLHIVAGHWSSLPRQHLSRGPNEDIQERRQGGGDCYPSRPSSLRAAVSQQLLLPCSTGATTFCRDRSRSCQPFPPKNGGGSPYYEMHCCPGRLPCPARCMWKNVGCPSNSLPRLPCTSPDAQCFAIIPDDPLLLWPPRPSCCLGHSIVHPLVDSVQKGYPSRPAHVLLPVTTEFQGFC